MSQSPEEQQSTGVLGRIGSWLAPWRGKVPTSPTENAPASSGQALKSEEEKESEESVRLRTGTRESEQQEAKGRPSNRNPLRLSGDVFPCEAVDATQSAHRGSSVVSSAEKAGGDPKKEEFVECRRERVVQGKQREESGSGNPETNARQVTHLSFSAEQDAVRESDLAPGPPQAERQAQAGRRLRVYLEETSVTHCDQNPCAGQDIVRVTKKSLDVLAKANSSPSLGLSANSTRAENKKTNVRPVVGGQSYYSALVGVSLKSHKESQSEPESEGPPEADSMGRKNATKRKVRKNSQVEEGHSSQEKMPPSVQPVPEGIPTTDNPVTSPKAKSPKSDMGESSVNSSSSSSKPHASAQASPEGAENKSSCPDKAEPSDNKQDSNSVVAATPAGGAHGGADMEVDSTVYRVQRKTETPESKRLSIKVSRSEVKLFTKNVPLNPKKNPDVGTQETEAALKNQKDEAKDYLKTESDAGLHKLDKKTDEGPKPSVGRISDKISLFEGPAAGVNKRTVQSQRSVDSSPAPGRLKADLLRSENRSRSADRSSTARSGSPSPTADKPMATEERPRNFVAATETKNKPVLPRKPDTAGMSQQATSSVVEAVSKSSKVDNQGQLDTVKQIQQAKPEIALKPDGQDTTGVGLEISIPKEQSTDSNANRKVASRTSYRGTKSNSLEINVPAKGPGDELTDSISPQSKGPSRKASRSKRRKSLEPTSPISPTSEKKPDRSVKPELTANKQAQVDEAASASKPLTEKASLPSTDTEQKALKKEPGVLLSQKKKLDSSFKKKSIDKLVTRQEGIPEPSIKKDEPDKAASSSGTKALTVKDPVISPQKEKEAGEHSHLFPQRREKASKESTETSASSPLSGTEQPIKKTDLNEQEPRVEQPKKELSVRAKSTEPDKKDTPQTQKDIDLIDQAMRKDAGKLEQAESEKTKQPEKHNKDKAQQLLHSEKNATTATTATTAAVSESRPGFSETEACAAGNDEITTSEAKDETQRAKVTTKPESNRPETDSPSSEPDSASAQKQGARQTKAANQKAAVCAVPQPNEAASATEAAAEPPLKAEAATGPRGSPTRPAEGSGAAREPVVVAAEPEKTQNSPDDPCARLPRPKPIATATTAAEKVAAEAAAAGAPPALTTAHAASPSPKESSGGTFSPSSVSKLLSGDAARRDAGGKSSTVKPVPLRDLGDVTKPAPRPQKCERSPDMESTSAASKPAVDVVEKTVEKTHHSLVNEPPRVANWEISPRSQLEKEQVKNKPGKTPRANEATPGMSQHATVKKLQSRDDSALRRDAPSSWLDVDFPKRTLKVSAPKLTSSGSENNLLDTPGDRDDNDFIEKIQKLCAPFSLPPRKHNPLRTPQPPFAMPAIKEARCEKTFDPEEFKFGLSKKSQFCVDTAPSLLASKYQDKETKAILKPARASLADRSMLLGILDPHSRLRDNTPVKDEDDVKEEREDPIKVKSRLEGSCVLNSLTSSGLRGRRNGAASPGEGPQLSPTREYQPPPPSPTSRAPLGGGARTADSVLGDSGLPLPAFNDIKLQDYLEKYLPQEPAKPEHSIKGEERVTPEVIEKMTSATSGGEADLAVKLGRPLPASPRLPEIPPSTHPTLFELKKPPALPQAVLSHNKRTEKGFHKRPGKMVLFEKPQFSGQVHEIYRDIADATSLQLSPVISVKVVRGCWVIYEKPDFQGRCIALEEGGTELTNIWAEAGPETEPQNNPPMLIGSIRLAVSDYSLPHIDLFTEPEGLGRVTPYHDDTVETGSFGIPLSTASIRVHSGVWLVFSDPGFQGMITVLETGEYPHPDSWGFTSPFVGSLRPLKMGGFKVENPNDVKAVLYGEPGLEGAAMEIDSDVFSFCESEGDVAPDADSGKPLSVASLKITGGLWVGYSEPGFEGQQYVLEEGEYLHCGDWGGCDQLGSLRPISADFMSPHLKMFSDKDFGELGVNIDLTVPVIDMEGTGYGVKTQSIDVIGGVWVAFEEAGFCGECYLLEKGLYGSPEDWGALQPRVASAMPVVLDDFENAEKFKLQIFSEPGFQGSVVPLEDSVASLQDGVSVASCKVLAGSWLAFEGRDFTGRMYLLELGSYPDLRAMGCANAKCSILSLQTVGFEFSLPSITLFERCGLWGKRVVLTEGSVNLHLVGGCSRVQSVLVEGGMWVLYEGINYRGPQILLKPGEVPDWRKVSSWQKIGSLRPLMQKRVHFRLRNRQTGLMMSVTGDLDDVKLMRVQETEETDGFEQIWHYQNGHLHCKLLEECCLSPSGSVTMAGSRVGLSPEPDNQDNLWSITPQGFIRYSPTPDLVLEVKGGKHYDKNQVILNKLNPAKLDQQWDVEII
ncbi:crybg1 [Pungitius sinensis]